MSKILNKLQDMCFTEKEEQIAVIWEARISLMRQHKGLCEQKNLSQRFSMSLHKFQYNIF